MVIYAKIEDYDYYHIVDHITYKSTGEIKQAETLCYHKIYKSSHYLEGTVEDYNNKPCASCMYYIKSSVLNTSIVHLKEMDPLKESTEYLCAIHEGFVTDTQDISQRTYKGYGRSIYGITIKIDESIKRYTVGQLILSLERNRVTGRLDLNIIGDLAREIDVSYGTRNI